MENVIYKYEKIFEAPLIKLCGFRLCDSHFILTREPLDKSLDRLNAAS